MNEQVQQSIADSLRAVQQADGSLSTAYDSIWASGDASLAALSPLTQVMLSDDKIFVVLAVLTTIWIGIILFLVRTDRRINELERTLADRIHEEDLDL